MGNIVRRREFEDPFEDLFRGFFVRPLAFETPAAAGFRMDVSEGENAFRVKADLPGVRKEDIAVTVDGDTVTISAEVRAEKDAGANERVLRTERHAGKLSRAFSLGQDVDESSAEAKYVDGVLELVLPKKAAATRRRLTIN